MEMLGKLTRGLITAAMFMFAAGSACAIYSSRISASESRLTKLEDGASIDHDIIIKTKQRVDDIADFLKAPRKN